MRLFAECQPLVQSHYLTPQQCFSLFYFQDAEYIGEIFQDEINRAALIMYEDKEDNALLMVSYSKLSALPSRTS
jgi:hypothetical protein